VVPEPEPSPSTTTGAATTTTTTLTTATTMTTTGWRSLEAWVDFLDKKMRQLLRAISKMEKRLGIKRERKKKRTKRRKGRRRTGSSSTQFIEESVSEPLVEKLEEELRELEQPCLRLEERIANKTNPSHVIQKAAASILIGTSQARREGDNDDEEEIVLVSRGIRERANHVRTA